MMKSTVAFIKALLFLVMLSHSYMFVFLIAPHKLSQWLSPVLYPVLSPYPTLTSTLSSLGIRIVDPMTMNAETAVDAEVDIPTNANATTATATSTVQPKPKKEKKKKKKKKQVIKQVIKQVPKKIIKTKQKKVQKKKPKTIQIKKVQKIITKPKPKTPKKQSKPKPKSKSISDLIDKKSGRPIQIKQVVNKFKIGKVRDELTQEQLQRIHHEISNEPIPEMFQNNPDPNPDPNSNSNSNPNQDDNDNSDYQTKLDLIKTTSKNLHSSVFTFAQLIDSALDIFQTSLQPRELFQNPQITSVMKNTMGRLKAMSEAEKKAFDLQKKAARQRKMIERQQKRQRADLLKQKKEDEKKGTKPKAVLDGRSRMDGRPSTARLKDPYMPTAAQRQTQKYIPGMSQVHNHQNNQNNQHIPGMSQGNKNKPHTHAGVVSVTGDVDTLDTPTTAKAKKSRPIIDEKDFNQETLKIKADTLFAFLNSTILFENDIDSITMTEIETERIIPPLYSLSMHELDDKIYKPIQSEFEALLDQYKNGNVGMKDIKDAFKYHGIAIDEEDEEAFIVDRSCDVDFLTVPKNDKHILLDDADDEEEVEEEEQVQEEEEVEVEEEEEEEEEDLSMYANKDDLSKLINEVQQEVTQFYFTSDKNNDNNEISMTLPMTPEHLSKLQNTVIQKLESKLEESYQELMNKYYALQANVKEFDLILEDVRQTDYTPKIDKEDDICVNQTEVEHLVHHSLNNVMRNSMDVRQAMKILIDEYNTNLKEMRKKKPTDNPKREEISYDVLEEVPMFQQPSNLMQSMNYKKDKLKDFMNVPMVPYMIKALDEGIEMIAGYNESLDRIIDFIAGLTATNNDDSENDYDYSHHQVEEEGSVGKTIESGLLHLLNKFDVPQRLTNMNRKAGILSRQ